jgi:hypothetical protein
MKSALLAILGLFFIAVPAFAQVSAGAGATQETPQQPNAQPQTPQLQATQPPTSAAPAAPAKPCLIVTSAEGHRFRNAMIGGVLTGGVGLAAGAAFSGGRYEYRDSFNLPQSDMKAKYKGPELQKLQQDGVHVVVVDKKDKTGAEVKDARVSCQH